MKGGWEYEKENILDCGVREVKEETGLDFTPKKKFGFYESHVGGRRYFALVYLGVCRGEIELQKSEVQDFKWASYKEAKELSLAFAYRDVIEDLYKNKLIYA